jgi:hypothetical protein
MEEKEGIAAGTKLNVRLIDRFSESLWRLGMRQEYTKCRRLGQPLLFTVPLPR